ncbi:MAG: Txe/YoeB family addiction module toxin [Bacteroidales bacterium]|nr:Txe/YoeB family addiction module toxin [Bacteroidales bacterium]
MYNVILSDKAQADYAIFKKSNPRGVKKIKKLIEELEKHPTTGTGHVEPLRGNLSGLWSRHIDDKNRLIYCIDDGVVKIVTIVQMIGHYYDK